MRFTRSNPIGLLNLEIKRSTYNAIAFDVYENDEVTPFDMTAYSGARLSVRANGNETSPAIEISTTDSEITLLDGSVLLEFPSNKTGVSPRPYNYDLFVTDNGNEVCFLSGVFKVIQEY